MPTRNAFDYAVVRVVPRVDREEFVNVGVLLYCLKQDFLEVRYELSPARLNALWPSLDLAALGEHLEAMARVCRGGADAGPLGALSQKERWHWLTAPRSTVLQTSAVHAGLCDRPETALERLMQQLVRVPNDAAPTG